jgi:hypothetical protein
MSKTCQFISFIRNACVWALAESVLLESVSVKLILLLTGVISVSGAVCCSAAAVSPEGKTD